MFCERCYRTFDAVHAFCPHDGRALVPEPDLSKFPFRPSRLAGHVLGDRYKIRGFVGKGAMARVYLADDLATKKPVAVKVLDTDHVKNARHKARFIQEAKAISTVSHPNIVEVHDIGLREDGSPYLVMEFLFGEALGDLLRREKVLTKTKGLPLVRQIALGLGAAHAAKIIHRDVKPDNVFLVGEQGSPYGVKLVDFGFAKLLGKPSHMTQSGVAIGTVEYMAPEQVVSDLPDPRTDIYGLGVTMFRMFSGKLPFEGKDEADILAKQLVEAPPRAALDPEIDVVVAKAMKKDPANRYASMEELVADVDRLIAGDPVGARFEKEEHDVYIPQTKFAESAANYLYKRLKLTPPSW